MSEAPVEFNVWLHAIRNGIDAVGDDACAAAAAFILQAGAAVTAGNGGSAALAAHMAQAIAKPGYAAGDGRAAYCASDSVPTLTAHANDGGWPDALAECARPALFAWPRCVVVLFSSSGRSENILRLAHLAAAGRHPIIAFTGFGGEPLRGLATISLHVDSSDYEVIEPAHDALMHRIQYHLRQLA